MEKKTDLTAPIAIMGFGFAIAALVLPALQAPVWSIILLVFILISSTIALLNMHTPKRRHALLTSLTTQHYAPLYLHMSGPVIGWLWHRLCHPVAKTASPWIKLRAAFSWRLYDKALLLAVVYPIMVLVGVWVITGADARLGDVVVQKAAGFWPDRAATLGAIAIIISGVLGDKRAAASPNRVIRQASGWLTPLAVAVAFAVAGAVAFAFAFAFAFAVAVAGAFAFAVAGAVALEYLDKRQKQALARWLLSLFLPLLLLAAIYWLPWSDTKPQQRAIFIFFGLFPLLNAGFDFASYAITLTLLRLGQRSRFAALFGLLDLVVATALFFALGASLVIILTFFNQLADAPLFDMGALFAGLRDDPAQYWWLYLMLFSTLLPTALHLLTALFATQALLPPGLRMWLHDKVKTSPDDVLHASLIPFGIGLLWSLPFIVVAAALWAIWHYWIGAWGIDALWWYFDQMFALAQWVGAF